jgi:hypothetical protein
MSAESILNEAAPAVRCVEINRELRKGKHHDGGQAT